MQSVWFKGIPKRDHEQRKKDLMSYQNAFDALREVLVNMETTVSPKADYDSPSWAFKQADRNGEQRMLQTVLKLIDIKDDHV